MRRNRSSSPTKRYRVLWEAQGKCCGICGEKMLPVTFAHPTRGWTIEHVWPRSRYNYWLRGNCFVSHANCNSAKSDRDPTGCEQIMLAVVNACLGAQLTEKPPSHEIRCAPRTPIDWRKVIYA